MTRAKKIYYVQFGQLGVVIEDSRWQLLYLVVTQFPNKKRYSMISAKSVTFFEIVAIPGYFVFKFSCWINGLFVSCLIKHMLLF